MLPGARFAFFARALSVASLVAARADAAPTLGAQFDLSPPNTTASTNNSGPALATNGTDALVVWTHAQTVTAARFRADGSLPDQESITLGLTSAPSVFWDGAKYLVVAGRSAQHVDPATGAVDTPWGSWGAANASDLGAAMGGGFVLDLWTGYPDTPHATILDTNGNVVKADVALTGFGTLSGSESIAVAYSSGHFLVAATNCTTSDTGIVRAVRVSTAGVVEDASPIVIDAGHTLPSASDAGPPALASTASLAVAGSTSGFLVSWTDGRGTGLGVYVARVATSGTVTDPGGFLVANDAADGVPSATWTGADWWIAWNDDGFTWYVDGATIAANGTVSAATVLGDAYTGTGIAAPALGVAPQTRFAAWKTVGGEIRGGRFDANGTALDGLGIEISYQLVPQAFESVTASSAGYLASWYEQFTEAGTGDILYHHLARRFAADGAPMDAAPVLLGDGAIPSSNAVATMGDSYVGLVGLGLVTLAETGDATVTALGSFPGTLVANPSVGCMSDRCLVTWEDWTTEDFYETVISQSGTATAASAFAGWGTAGIATNGTSFLVTGDGTVPIGADGTVGTALAVSGGAIAWGDGEYLIVTSGGLARLSSGGAQIGGTEALPSFTAAGPPIFAWDGRSFLMVQGSQAVEVPATPPTTAAPFALFDTATASGVASNGAGNALVIGTDLRGGVQRAVGRVVQTPAVPDAGSDAGDDAGSDASGDAGSGDAGGSAIDAGASSDASAGDGGANDADATPSDDAGVSPPSNSANGDGSSGGCGCSAAGAGTSPFAPIAALLSALVMLARRSRRAGRNGA
jgi:uncharacterized protein (TIGR03382 family)